MEDREVRRSAIDMWFERQRDALIRDLGRLIAIKSVRSEAPSGKPFGEGPAAALDEAVRLLEEKGFSPENIDNCVVTAELNSAQPVLGILAHLDTVAAGDGWNSNPYALFQKDGKLFGRGVIDNKGPAVAAIYALMAARELAPELTKGCQLLLGSAEETGHDDLSYYRRSRRLPPYVFTPDASYPIVNLEKGRLKPTFGASWPEYAGMPRLIAVQGGDTANMVPNYAEAVVEGLPLAYIQARCVEFNARTGASLTAAAFHDGIKITSLGISAHAMIPAEGKNAQTALLGVLAVLPMYEDPSYEYIKALARLFPYGDTNGTALGIAMEDALSGPLTLNFGVMSLIPTGFTANFDSRFPISATDETLDDVAVGALRDAGFVVSEVSKIACHHTPEDSPIVQALSTVYEEFTGEKATCLALGGQTYVHDIEGGVAFGPAFPGVDNRLHAANEFIGVDELLLSAKMYTQVILDMCRG